MRKKYTAGVSEPALTGYGEVLVQSSFGGIATLLTHCSTSVPSLLCLRTEKGESLMFSFPLCPQQV